MPRLKSSAARHQDERVNGNGNNNYDNDNDNSSNSNSKNDSNDNNKIIRFRPLHYFGECNLIRAPLRRRARRENGSADEHHHAAKCRGQSCKNFEDAAVAPHVDPMMVVLKGSRRGAVHMLFLLRLRAWPRGHAPSRPGRALLGASTGRIGRGATQMLMRSPCPRAAAAATAAASQLLHVLLRHVPHQEARSLAPRFAPLTEVGDDLVNTFAGAEALHGRRSPHLGGARVLSKIHGRPYVWATIARVTAAFIVPLPILVLPLSFSSCSGCPPGASRCGSGMCVLSPRTSWGTAGPA